MFFDFCRLLYFSDIFFPHSHRFIQELIDRLQDWLNIMQTMCRANEVYILQIQIMFLTSNLMIMIKYQVL